MTARSLRRAAERASRKAGRKQSREAAAAPVQPEPSFEVSTESIEAPEDVESPAGPNSPASEQVSPDRPAINRANAQHSTGPKSVEGKATSSKNALKTALTGRTVLLPGDDADRYERHLAHYEKLHRPVGLQERELVQALADTMWRLDRIPGLEEALYVKGFHELASTVSEMDPHQQAALLRLNTYLAYERQFRNLNIQEMRLFRHREKLIAEIQKLQKERDQQEAQDFDVAAKLYIKARADRKPFNPADHGFEFSTSDVEHYLEGVRAAHLAQKALETGNFPLPQRAKAA